MYKSRFKLLTYLLTYLQGTRQLESLWITNATYRNVQSIYFTYTMFPLLAAIFSILYSLYFTVGAADTECGVTDDCSAFYGAICERHVDQ